MNQYSKVIAPEDADSFTSWHRLNQAAEPEPEEEPEEELPPEPEPDPAPSAEEIAAIKQAAHDQGYAEGLTAGQEAGKAQGLTEGQQQITQHCTQLEQLCHQLETPLRQLDQQVEQTLLQLVQQLARGVIRAELKWAPEHILSLVQEALAQLPERATEITVYLHPSDVDQVQQAYALSAERQSRRQFEADPSLQPGECRVTSNHSRVDVPLEARIEQLCTQMLGEANEH